MKNVKELTALAKREAGRPAVQLGGQRRAAVSERGDVQDYAELVKWAKVVKDSGAKLD